MDSKLKGRAILIGTLLVLTIVAGTLLLNRDKLIKKPAAGTSATGTESVSADTVSKGGPAEGADLKAFLRDETFFDKELTGYEKRLLEANDKLLYPIVTSVERDLRIRITDRRGTILTGYPFTVSLGDGSSYKDGDEDGVVYISGLSAGDYSLTVDAVGEYEASKPITATVRDKVEYTPISDITLLMKTEADIRAELEDTAVRDADGDKDSSEIKDIRDLGGSGTVGVDVSKWNGTIDWDKVRESGIRFALVRAGYRGSSSGNLVEDPFFHSNMQGALYSGLQAGVYFFTQATTEVEAVEEASMVLELCKDYLFRYPIFVDTEGAGGNGRADDLDAETRTKVVKAFCETIENAGYSAGVYASRNWLNGRLNREELEDYIIWLAEYRETPLYSDHYQLWQYTSSGSVNGIEGRVDLNISFLTY